MKKTQRVVVSLLLFLISISLVPSKANTLGNASDATVEMVISNKLQSLNGKKSGYADDRGILYYLASLGALALWNDAANNNNRTTISASLREPYKDSLAIGVKDFNNRYQVSPSENSFIATSIDDSQTFENYSDSDQLKKYADYMASEIIEKSSEQASAVFTKLNDGMKDMEDSEKQTYLTENSQTVRALYTLILRVSSEYKTIQSLVNINDKIPMYKKDITSLTKQLADPANQTIINFAQDLEEKTLRSGGNLALSDDKNDLNRLLATYNGDNLLINQAYLAIVACSATYLPFSSKLGEESFTKSLTSIVGEEKEGQEVLALYNRQKAKLKPLYMRQTTADGEGKGSAERITVEEFLKNIEDQSSGSLVTVKGKFRKSEDSDSFAYYTKTETTKLQYDDNGEEVTETEDNTSENAETKTSNGNGAEIEEGETGELLATGTITDSSRLSDPVFRFSENDDKNSSMGRILMWNILKDYKTDDLESEYNKQLLYVNMFGDIVLSDLTVIIPAAANPTFLNKEVSYNPNTAAFMNSYPKTALNSETLSVTDRDKEKFIIVEFPNYTEATQQYRTPSHSEATELLGLSKVGPTVKCDTKAIAYTISENKEAVKTFEFGDSTMPLSLEMYDESLEGVQTMKAKYMSSKWYQFNTANKFNGALAMVPDSGRSLNFDVPAVLFPLNKSDNSNYDEVCSFIAKKFFDDITVGEDSTRSISNGRVNVQLLTDTLICAYEGETNIAMFTKNIYDEYSKLDEVNIVTKGLMILDEKILTTLGGVSGILGIKNAYQDPVFGTILLYTKKFMPFVLLVVALYFIISFIRKRCNIIFSVACILGSLVLTYAGLQVLPIYIPILVNGTISSFSDEVSYKSLFMRQEQYLNPYEMKASYDDNGNFSYSTSSINLYRFSNDQIDSFASRYNTTSDNLKSGKAVMIDDNSGLFVEGDLIKMNLDRLFGGLTITGNYENSSEGNVYRLKSSKKVSNVVDYYTPYYAIVDSYINKLNKLSEVYNIPREQLYYGNSLYKDSFINSSYVNSDLFLNRGRFDKIQYESQEGQLNLSLMEENFPDQNVDWIGLQSVVAGDYFKSNLDSIKDTLWFQSMVTNGYYDQDGNIVDEDKLAKVLDHVNNTTQQFLIDNSGQLSHLSDENIIKITCMYALIDFNICVSDWKCVLYPQALNYEELTLEDVLLPVLTKDYDRYTAQKRNIVSYIASDFGIIGLILFAFVAILAFLICWAMRIVIPILYFILIISVILRLSLKNNSSVSSIFWGFAQIAGGILLSYAAFCYLTSTAYKFNDSAFCLFFLLICYYVIATIIFSMLMSLATNLGDFSSIKVKSTLGDIGKKFNKLPGVKKISQKAGTVIQDVRNKRKRRNAPAEVVEDMDGRRTFHYSEDIYNEDVLDGIMSSRHNYASYNTPDKKKKKIVYRRNKVSKDYEYEETPKEESFDKFEL